MTESIRAAATAARRAIQQWPISHSTVILGGADLHVKFTPIPRYEWETLTRQHPPRADVPQDAANGYNLPAVVAGFPSISVSDHAGVQLNWAQTWERLAPGYRRRIAENVWAAHEAHPDAISTHPEEEADLARQMGVTVRELNGAAPVTVTFDAEGNLLSTSVTEPRFDSHEKSVLIASLRAEREPRGGHGIKLREATDPANQFAYVTPAPTRDFAATALRQAQERYQKANPNADTSSLLWRVEKRGE